MDLLQACVNCGIAVRERIRRHVISSLPPDMTVLLTAAFLDDVLLTLND